MIEQRPTNTDGTPGKWDTEEDGYVPRERAWHASIMSPGMSVVVRSMPVLAAGEDWSGYPPTYELTWEEWETSHETTYQLALDGTPVAIVSERKAAWRKGRRFANGTTEYTEQSVRDAVGALLRIIKDAIPEVTD